MNAKGPFEVLEETSRTFALPIQRLNPPLRETVAAAYLCMRAIDEIEDHPGIDGARKDVLLCGISDLLQGTGARGHADLAARYGALLAGLAESLPEVTRRLPEWLELAEPRIRPRVEEAIATMAARMGAWAREGFRVRSEADLDRYTFAVAGAVGVLLCDLFAWHDGTRTDRDDAVAFGRGLQAVNIARNRDEDLGHGVDFFPEGFTRADMHAYARRHLAGARRYTESLPPGPIREFCAIPLALAAGTLEAMEAGRAKLTRPEVLAILQRALGGASPAT